jgi:hypothetical protein
VWAEVGGDVELNEQFGSKALNAAEKKVFQEPQAWMEVIVQELAMRKCAVLAIHLVHHRHQLSPRKRVVVTTQIPNRSRKIPSAA